MWKKRRKTSGIVAKRRKHKAKGIGSAETMESKLRESMVCESEITDEYEDVVTTEESGEEVTVAMGESGEDVTVTMEECSEEVTVAMAESGDEVTITVEESGEEVTVAMGEGGEEVTVTMEESGKEVTVTMGESGEEVIEESDQEVSSEVIVTNDEEGIGDIAIESLISASAHKKPHSRKKEKSLKAKNRAVSTHEMKTKSKSQKKSQSPSKDVRQFPKKKAAVPRKQKDSPTLKKRSKNLTPKKKLESPASKKKTESPKPKKKAGGPSPERKAKNAEKAAGPALKMRVKSLFQKKKGTSHKRRSEILPSKIKPLKEKTESTPSMKDIKHLQPEDEVQSPPSKQKKLLRVGKKLKNGLKKDKKKNGIKKKPIAFSKQEHEVEEQKPIQHEVEEQPIVEIEQFKEPEVVYDPEAAAREDERKERQLQETAAVLENYDFMYHREKLKDWENEQWKRYLQGCGKANPLTTREANGYITTWKDLIEDEDVLSILRESHSCLELIKELELAIEEFPFKTLQDVKAWILTHKNLHTLLQDKLDIATYQLLKHAAEYLDPDTYNMRLVTSDVRAIQNVSGEKVDEAEIVLLENNASILLCIWANLAKNPRFKGPNFNQIGHSVELPRSLLVTDCALRILHTSYDPYSLYRLNEKQRQQEPVSGKKKESDEENSEMGADAATVSAATTVTPPQDEISTHVIPSTISKQTRKKKKQGKAGKTIAMSKVVQPETEIDKKDEEEDELPGSVTVPEKVFLPQMVVDMKSNYIVGGVFHIDLVAIPPLPVTTTYWILEQVENNPKLQHITYRVVVTPPRPPKPGETPTQAAMFAEAENRRYEDELTSAISVTLKLPENILFLDQPQLAFWDEDNTVWLNEGIHELKYNEDNKSLTFKIVHFGVIGILQNKYVNFPYQAWELKPHEFSNSCSLSITGAQVSLVIEILGGKCCISQLQTIEDSVLHTELCNEWMKPQLLLKKLKSIGVYIIPDDHASTYLGNTPKETVLEDNVYKFISLFADAYMFGSSHWNSTVGPRRIVMKYSPTCGKDTEGINSLLLVEAEKAIFLQCVEQSPAFRDDPLTGSECCMSPYHLLLSGATPTGIERMNNSSDEYCSCVYRLLSSIKLLSY